MQYEVIKGTGDSLLSDEHDQPNPRRERETKTIWGIGANVRYIYMKGQTTNKHTCVTCDDVKRHSTFCAEQPGHQGRPHAIRLQARLHNHRSSCPALRRRCTPTTPLSRGGDSGAAIVGANNDFIAQLTSGSGPTDSSGITYGTPPWSGSGTTLSKSSSPTPSSSSTSPPTTRFVSFPFVSIHPSLLCN